MGDSALFACGEVAVIHSPGFSDLIAETPFAGTGALNVTYWWAESNATNSTGNVNRSSCFFAASYRTAWLMASAYLSNPDQVSTIRSPALNFPGSAIGCSPTTRDLTVRVRAFSSRATSSPFH